MARWTHVLTLVGALGLVGCNGDPSFGPALEVCSNGIDDDLDGVVDCVDADCRDQAGCTSQSEICNDGLDNDFDGDVDCSDADCAGPACTEICDNGVDDDGDGNADCADSQCMGRDASCGEICGDGKDNDGDKLIDCNDADCAMVNPPCGMTADGTICAYQGSEPHVCACADGEDNDGDGVTDGDDLQCFGPFDDNELDYATGIPGDNNGANGDSECPFDGNSGPGNDNNACCNQDASQNLTPNGCDSQACCEIDVNGDSRGEYVYVRGACDFHGSCTGSDTLGCACNGDGDCDNGQFCVTDQDGGKFCSVCEPCAPAAECLNACSCGETCFGGFERPDDDCGVTSDPNTSDPNGPVITCPGGAAQCTANSDCDASNNEQCANGCCFQVCPTGVTMCSAASDCSGSELCITGCCIAGF